ncbi:MAG: DUF6512 family protein [Propionicimonas sp.]
MGATRAAGTKQQVRARSRRVGLAFVAVAGTFWHFVYDLSGGSALVGLVAPVNESVWEHTKLVSVPLLAWTLWSTRHTGRARSDGRSRAPVAVVTAALAGSAVIVVGFYAYVGVLGADQFVMDIALFLVAAWVAVWTFDLLMQVAPALPGSLGLLLVVGLLAALALLTVAPPDWPMFRAP